MSRSSLKSVCRLIDSITKEIPVEQKFIEDLERSIELSDKKNAKVPSKTYKPSSMNCLRQMYYQVKGEEPEESKLDYAFIGICNSGTDIHIRVQDAIADMKNNNINCEYIDVANYVQSRNLEDIEIISKQGNETKLFNKKLNMSFLCDGIIKYNDHYYILEIKSESGMKWNQRSGVDYKHHNQAISYSTSLNLDDVIFVYVSRDLLFMKAYLFHVTDEMRNNLIERIKLCDDYLIQNEVPLKEDNLPKGTCNYCNYKTLCQRNS